MREQLSQQGVSVIWIDIDDDPALEERFGDLVPVLASPVGREICHYQLDQSALDAYLADLS